MSFLAIEAVWTLFLDWHLGTAWAAGYLPHTFFDQFARLRDEPDARVILDEIRTSPPEEERMRSIATMLAQPNLTNNDRGWLAYVLTQSKRYDEAVEQFRVLGTDASGGPWASWDDGAKLISPRPEPRRVGTPARAAEEDSHRSPVRGPARAAGPTGSSGSAGK